ncbi:MAG: tRNA (adenosine(37)-N6)-dimethylallyltransferase MiaA [Chloroflexota bacterium]|nr:tRNA (adenosine(37)-N6)-dimethylallyltransferase MiaA [Chloroflexota bacterium]
MNHKSKLPLIIIVGPTAAGKTAVSIDLAQRFSGEIVSADSCLLYRGMDIGTAKPTKEERQCVPHHLIDVADPDESWSLGVYQREAYRAIDAIHERAKLPFLVGGTGQYIRSIIEGWQIPSQQPDLELRKALTHWAEDIGAEGLHERLSRLDSEAAAKIEPRNLRRTVRAFEVIFKKGKRFSELRSKQVCRYSVNIMGIQRSREELYARVDQRIDQMLDGGLVNEVRELLNLGYSPKLSSMSAIGYREIIQYLQGEISYEEVVVLMKRNTRTFIRRQANWFKPDDPRITWFFANEHLADEMETLIRRRLSEIE